MAWKSFRLDRADSRPAVFLLILLTAVLTAALTSLVWWSAREPAPPPPPAKPAPSPLAKVEPDPKLTRADLIAMAARAASALGAGIAAPDQSAMVGRPFELRIAFRCAAPDLTWSRDDEQKSLKLTARLHDWTGSPIALAARPEAPFDRVEGFWLPRPWTTEEGCAAPSAATPPLEGLDPKADAPEGPDSPKGAAQLERPAPAILPPTAQTLGLATFYSPASSRARQRGGKPYETVQKLTPELEALAGGDLFMVVQGRVDQATPGRPVVCHGPPDRQPVCLVAVDIERVAFLRKATPIAEWTR